MDIITLRVFNTIHKLGITEDEFKDIENEQKEKTHSGIYIATIKKNLPVYINHDEKHSIVIKPIEYDKLVYPSRILLKTLITFKDVPEQIYTLHQIGKYRALDTTIKHIANNMEELRDRILDRFTDGYPQELGGVYDDVYDDAYKRRIAKKKKPIMVEEQLRALYWLFGEEYDGKDIYSRLNVARIIKVWVRGNKRVALFQEKECWKLNRGGIVHNYQDIDRITYKIKTYFPKDWEYNYVCPGREVGLCVNEEYWDVWIDDDLFEKVMPDELEVIQNMKKVHLLTADNMANMRREIRLTTLKNRRSEEIKEAKEILVKNISGQFKDGKVVRSGITITTEGFSYGGISVKGKNMEDYIVRNNIIFLEEPNFNNILDGYIEYLLDIKMITDYYPYDRTVCSIVGEKNMSVGDINIKIIGEKGRIKVNGFRISRDEVEKVVKKVINYKTQEEYDAEVEKVSKVSLKLQGILDRGYFQFEVSLGGNSDCCVNLKGEKMVLGIPTIREGNKNFILIGKKKFRIKNTGSFFNLDLNLIRRNWRYSEGSELQRIIVQMHKAVRNLTAEDISKLIKEGIKNYRKQVIEEKKIEKEKIARSMEFLKNAVRITKAKKIKEGYIVIGLSGIEYSVNEESLAVYTLHDNKYLCIVDTHSDNSTNWGKNDIVAKRLLMLSKDIKVASEVYSSGDHMDKLWQEITTY